MGEKRNRRIKCLNWNVAGIANTWKAKRYIENFDIIMLQETWVEKDKEKGWVRKLSKKHKWSAMVAERIKKKGRAKGEVIVGISKEEKYEGMEEWKYGLKIRRIKVGRGDNVNVVVIYNNGKTKEMLEEIRKTIEEWIRNGETVILIGDFNARIGTCQINKEGEVDDNRESEDKKCNREGMQLLCFCKEIEGVIRNGSTKGD